MKLVPGGPIQLLRGLGGRVLFPVAIEGRAVAPVSGPSRRIGYPRAAAGMKRGSVGGCDEQEVEVPADSQPPCHGGPWHGVGPRGIRAAQDRRFASSVQAP